MFKTKQGDRRFCSERIIVQIPTCEIFSHEIPDMFSMSHLLFYFLVPREIHAHLHTKSENSITWRGYFAVFVAIHITIN